jgi:hypothetical protein
MAQGIRSAGDGGDVSVNPGTLQHRSRLTAIFRIRVDEQNLNFARTQHQ